MSSTKTNIAQARWRSWSVPSVFLLMALLLATVAMPESARAGELEYQNCTRERCTSYGVEENNCTHQQSCVRELNGSSNTGSQAVRYGAIAIETNSLFFGYMKDVGSREEAEKGALAYCRKANCGHIFLRYRRLFIQEILSG